MKKNIFLILFIILFPSIVLAQTLGINGQWLNKSVPDGRVDSVWNGINLPSGFSGEGVIIGVTDWGFDYSHPVFYDTTMTNYRVLRAWDQYKTSGPAPAGFDYGTEFVGQQALLEVACDTSNVYQYGYHGTHVSGIAAGAGAGTPYRGVAFGAELLFTSIRVSEQSIIDAFDWMYSVAQEEGKRLVINMSWGLYYMDNFTGTGAIGQKMEELSDLGVVFVTSAGNNGDVNFHLKHDFNVDSGIDTIKTIVMFTSGSPYQYGECITMTNSVQTPFSFSVQILDASYNALITTPLYNTENGNRFIDTFVVVNNDTFPYIAEIEKEDPVNLRPEVRLKIKKVSGYKIGLVLTAPAGIFHAWNVIELTNDVGNWGANFSTPPNAGNEWKSGDAYYGIGTPANVDCAISVAAYQPRVVLPTTSGGGAMADFSSYGPTINETMKPEISAPGKNIVSSISSYTNQFSGTYTRTISFNGRDYKFASLSGTSMSSPFVTGVVALILQANPYLSPAQIKEILMQSARLDNFTANAEEEQYGAGKIDAYHAVLLALETVGNENIIFSESQFNIFPNPSNGDFYVTAQSNFPQIEMEIFDITGKKVIQSVLESGVNHFNFEDISKGCYIVKITENNTVTIKKWIKN